MHSIQIEFYMINLSSCVIDRMCIMHHTVRGVNTFLTLSCRILFYCFYALSVTELSHDVFTLFSESPNERLNL